METTLDPIMTMLSIGVEKMQKMALGLIHVADHGEWPTYQRFKNHWRHDLTLMHSELLPQIRNRLHLATYPNHVEPTLTAVENDVALQPALTALTSYGVAGRFYHLDRLALHPQSGEAPGRLWDQAEREIWTSDPALEAEFHATVAGPVADFDAFLRRIEGGMADTIENYWELFCIAAIQGMLGERGSRSWGHDARRDMVGRQIRERT
jgi:hypothetical protein